MEAQTGLFDEIFDEPEFVAVNNLLPATLEEKVKLIIESTKHGILNKGWEICSSLSGGKDSMTTLSLSLVAMAMAMTEFPKYLIKPKFHIVSSNTLMENLVKEDYLQEMIAQAVVYGKKHGFEVLVHRPSPDRSNSFLKIFSGIKPDPTPNINSAKRECAKDYKVRPIQLAMRSVNHLSNQIGKKLIMTIGSRSEESKSRADSLRKMSANSLEPIMVEGYWSLYPIMDWSLDDVWQYLVFAEDDFTADLPGYKNGFPETTELYSSLNGGECVAGLQQSENACSARDGCNQCGAVSKDTSSENQSNSKELYHLKRTISSLLALRDYRIEMGKNYQNRNFVSMVDDDGHLSVKANGYAGWLLEENLRVLLTIQEMDRQRASDQFNAIDRIEQKLKLNQVHNPQKAKVWLRKVKKHAKPLLHMIDESDIVWIDFQWSLRGLTRQPHMAIRIWHEVVNEGKWAEIPNQSSRRPLKVTDRLYQDIKSQPPRAKIKHGMDLTSANFNLVDPLLDMHEGYCSDEVNTITNANGDFIKTEMLNVSDKYDISDEAARWICSDPSLVLKRCNDEPKQFIHQNAIRRLLRLGAVQVNKSQLNVIALKMELLEFTAISGLQDFAYTGGVPTIKDIPELESCGDSVIQMFTF